jgi:glutathione synthase/RimK-type ligase-like ATP-grasp enzyme
MSATSEVTTDHDTIRKWAESRNGRPAVVKGTEDKEGEGILRIEFRHGDKLEDVDWKTFFETFEDRKLAFLYQDKTADGKPSRFFKFVSRDR